MSGDQQDNQQGAQDGAGEYEDIAENTQAQGSSESQADGANPSSEQEKLIQEAVAIALAEQRDSVLRAQAEVQNMRRRCEADVEKAHKFALERFSGELINVVDNLERAMSAVPEEQSEQLSSFLEGVELTHKGFLEIFSKFHIQQISPEGEPFDPQLHQAVASIPNPDVEPNTVIEVMQKGYSLNDRVIRPAMVVVSKAG